MHFDSIFLFQSGSKDMADEDDFDEIDEEDRDRFYDQLVSIGHLARICPEQSVPPLTKWVVFVNMFINNFSEFIVILPIKRGGAA